MDDGNVDPYMQAIHAIPLLSEAEEAALGQRIAAGRQAAQRLPYAASDAERAHLECEITAATAAREQLITANLRWVVKLAYRHYHRAEVPDRIQDGNLGLMQAAEGFDAEKGRFTTYATLPICRAMQRGRMRMHDPIWLPEHLQLLRSQIGRLMQTLGRQPSIDELAAAFGCKPKHIRYALSDTSAASLDEPLSDGQDVSTLGEVTPDSYGIDPEEHVLRADQRRELFDALSRIPKHERAYLMRRYGLDDGQERTCEQTCAELGIEGGRLFERHALQAMRCAYRDIYREGQARGNALLAPPGQAAGQSRR